MNYDLRFGDCLKLLPDVPDKSIDMIFADLPYGTTNCKWDSVIPMNDWIEFRGKIYSREEFLLYSYKAGTPYSAFAFYWIKYHQKGLWFEYERIIKDNGAIVLFAQTPFDKILGASNPELLRYEWIWEKTSATGHLNAKKMPMKAHENLLVFYKQLPVYNPQMTSGHVRKVANQKNRVSERSVVYGDQAGNDSYDSTDRYPRSIQVFASDKQKNKLDKTIHPTQKPLPLCEYMIKTYTNEGDLVLDNTMGSAQSGEACMRTGRRYIGMDNDPAAFGLAEKKMLKYS